MGQYSIFSVSFLGTVFFVDDKGHTTTSFAVDGSVKTLLYYEVKDILVTVTDNMMLTQHSISLDGNTNEIMKVGIRVLDNLDQLTH